MAPHLLRFLLETKQQTQPRTPDGKTTMRWSWKMGEIAGIGVYVHSTFLILIAWITWSYWQTAQNLVAVAEGVGFVLALFGCVLLHELGHALAARRYGIKTRDITLLPIGGVARLDHMPDDPTQEMIVAIAGPLVNVVIAVALFSGLLVSGGFSSIETMSVASGAFFTRLIAVNIILVVFNMLPAFPMDGGRVLRAFLAMQMDHAKATQIAANVGQVMALGFGFLGLLFNPFLIFIALFVWIGAAQEAGAAQIKSAISGMSVREAMIRDFQTLRPTDVLQDAVDLTLSGSQKDFPIVENDTMLGLLTQSDLLTALTSSAPNCAVTDFMKTELEMVDPNALLESVLFHMEQSQTHTIAVGEQGKLIGMLTMDNIGELLRIQAALEDGRSRGPAQVSAHAHARKQ